MRQGPEADAKDGFFRPGGQQFQPPVQTFTGAQGKRKPQAVAGSIPPCVAVSCAARKNIHIRRDAAAVAHQQRCSRKADGGAIIFCVLAGVVQ